MGNIALVGGDEFRPNCITMDLHILSLLQKERPIVVIVPTAAAHENPHLAARNGTRYFDNLGAESNVAMILDRDDANNPDASVNLLNADIIYFTGGNPWFLLEALRDTYAWKKIVSLFSDGKMVAGSSAGAMVLAEKMRTRDSSHWIDALNLANNVAALPHHKKPMPVKLKPLLEALDPQICLIGIATGTACINTGSNSWEVSGSGTVTMYSRDSYTTFEAGEHFNIKM